MPRHFWSRTQGKIGRSFDLMCFEPLFNNRPCISSVCLPAPAIELFKFQPKIVRNIGRPRHFHLQSCVNICAKTLAQTPVCVYIFTHGNRKEQQEDHQDARTARVHTDLAKRISCENAQRRADSDHSSSQAGLANRHSPQHRKAGGLDLIQPAGIKRGTCAATTEEATK